VANSPKSVFELAYSFLSNPKVKNLDFGKDFKTKSSYQKLKAYLQSFKNPKPKPKDEDNKPFAFNLTNKDSIINFNLISHLSVERFKELITNQLLIQLKLSQTKTKFARFRLGGGLGSFYSIIPNDYTQEDLSSVSDGISYFIIYTFYHNILNFYYQDYQSTIQKSQTYSKQSEEFLKKHFSKEVIESYQKDSKKFKVYKKEYQEYCKNIQTKFTKHRRLIRTIQRLNYLRYTNFSFGRCTAFACGISNDYINNPESIRVARQRFARYLRSKGVRYYVVAKERGSKNDRLHYHYIAFNSPFLDHSEVINAWGLGYVYIQEVVNKKTKEPDIASAVFYLTRYLKKGLNFQFSRSWFKDGIIDNDVYYLIEFDKDTKQVHLNDYSKKFFNKRLFVSKNEFRSFFAHYDIEATQKTVKLHNTIMDVYNLYTEEADYIKSWLKISKDNSQKYLDNEDYQSYFYWDDKLKAYQEAFVPIQELLAKYEERLSKVFFDSIEVKKVIPAPYIFFEVKIESRLQKIYKKNCNYRC